MTAARTRSSACATPASAISGADDTSSSYWPRKTNDKSAASCAVRFECQVSPMFLQLGDLVLSAMMSEFVHRPAREASAALSKPSTGRFYSELNSSRCRQGPLQGRNVLNY